MEYLFKKSNESKRGEIKKCPICYDSFNPSDYDVCDSCIDKKYQISKPLKSNLKLSTAEKKRGCKWIKEIRK